MNGTNLCGLARQYSRSSRFSTVLSGMFLPALLIGCAAGPMIPKTANAQDPEPLPLPQSHPDYAVDDRAQLMYELMIAELAGRRGYLDVATEGYLSASKRTDDVRVAERATKLAVWGSQWDLAQQAADRWLELEPDSSEARELLAQILMRSDQPEGAALDQFANLVENAEDRGVVLNDIYILMSREQDRPAALATLKGLQSRFPEEIEAHLGLARFLLQQNDRDAALVAVEQALALNAEHGEALLLRAQMLAEQGKDYLYENASDNSDVLLSIGLLALDSKRTDAAKRYLETLLSTGDHRDQAHYYLARIDDQQQAFADAIKHYESVGEGELYLSSQLRSAELYAASGELDVGIERVRSLSSILPDPAMQPMLITTESRMLQDAGRDTDAVGVLSDGLEKFPLNGDLLYARALASDRTGDTETLMSDLNTLITEEPENASALNALGYFLADDNQRLDEAEVHLEKAISLRPDDPAILDSLGWLRFRQGNSEAAKRLLERAYELLPDGEIAAHLGEVLWVIGDKSAARSIWNKALLDAPEHDKLNNTVERLTQ